MASLAALAFLSKLLPFKSVATPGTLSRVFLFHFEKISGVSVNIGQNSRFGIKKKKIFLKPKQICILYTEKPQKEKKNEKKRNEQRYLTINYKFI